MSDVTTKEIDWASLVKDAEGDQMFEPVESYVFSTGRKFIEQDPHGPYEYEVFPE